MKSVYCRTTNEEIPVGKIICVARNYREHAKEMDSETPERPILFLKPSTAIIRSGQEVILPPFSRDLHYEVEFVVVIVKEGKNIQRQSAHDHILGYAVGLDMTLRDVQLDSKKKGLPWSVAKGFDTSAPVSDIITKEEMRTPQNVNFSLRVNQQIRQRGNTQDMTWGIESLISYVSEIFTLERGDVLFTGTPSGVGPVNSGDRLEAELEGLVTLTCFVR